MKVKMRKLLVVVFSLCLSGLAVAELGQRIEGIIRQDSQKKARFSIHIVKADSGEVLYSNNANEAMIPASNMKIIIGAAALKYLGPNFVYKTKVGLCGNTLAVIGSGDPLLGDQKTDAKYGRQSGWIFEDIAAKLKERGVTTIGDIIVDASVFDEERVHPNWPKDQLNQWYACEVGGVNYNDNCIGITVKNVGGRAEIVIQPQTDFVQIINEVVLVSEGKDGVGAYRNLEPNKIIVKGKCNGQEGPFDVAIERPGAFFGSLLSENLARGGVKMQGQLLVRAVGSDCDFKLVAEYSTSMADCLARCNKDSLALAADALLKTIAASQQGGKNGSWATGRAMISRYLSELGINESEFYIDDGSGLSRENKLSANAITKVLTDIYKGGSWGLYKDSLAAGGIDGTIRRYFKEEKYKGRIIGKTGFINGVRSFSGVCSSKDGDYIFSILANNSNGMSREAINDIAEAIIDETDM